MKLQISSDIHTEFYRGRDLIRSVVAKTDADVIVLAGDVGCAKSGHTDVPHWVADVKTLQADRGVPIIKIPGNHEYYHGNIEDQDAAHAKVAAESDGTILYGNPGIVWYQGIRFLLCTLWAADWKNEHGIKGRQDSQYGMNDYNLIGTKDFGTPYGSEWARTFRIEDMERINAEHISFLTAMLDASDEPTVVVTHHAPTRKSIMPFYRDSSVNGAYANNLEPLILGLKNQPKLWIHGHTHTSHDYMVGNTRVVCNPSGYLQSFLSEKNGGPVFENPEYNPSFVVEV
jgi:Icc-related predicted phosphoesterase